MSIVTYRLILAGLGNVGRSFVEVLRSQEALLRERFGVAFTLVGAADSGGSALDAAGLDLDALLLAKRAGRGVASLPHAGRPHMDGVALVRESEADLLLEATPVNLQHGQPGLDIVRAALARPMSTVLANKAPLVLAYAELAAMSDLAETPQGESHARPALRFSACVGGYLPTVNIGRRDLAGAQIERIEAVLNGTTQGILRMIENGAGYAEALAEMQRRGLAETDPTLDVEGWDAANKLVILANAVLRRPTTLADVDVTGIIHLTAEELREALSRTTRIVLLCLAEHVAGDYRLSVRPTALPLDHPLARMSGDEMGIVYYTDIGGRTSATSAERGPRPTAAAMLRDLLDITRRAPPELV